MCTLYLSRLDLRHTTLRTTYTYTLTLLSRSPFIRRLRPSAYKQTRFSTRRSRFSVRWMARRQKSASRYSAIVQSNIGLIVMNTLKSVYRYEVWHDALIGIYFLLMWFLGLYMRLTLCIQRSIFAAKRTALKNICVLYFKLLCNSYIYICDSSKSWRVSRNCFLARQ